ncbi:NAD(P)-binding protein [bacterium]|nr:NAD(P)-binding protein [bacterium]
MKRIENLILGAGISGIACGYELKKKNLDSLILEKNQSWGGLLDNFTIEGFRFDKFVHLSFAKDDYVNKIFRKTPLLEHEPRISNFYNGYWLKHPAQNNLFPLKQNEKDLILRDFKNRKNAELSGIRNYEQWLRVQFGNYFSENFPMVYTEKYWTLPAEELETKWIGDRLYRPTVKEVEEGCLTNDTPNTYYAKEMRYPKQGGYKSFLKPMVDKVSIKTNSEVSSICLDSKTIELTNGNNYIFKNLVSSLPLPEICKLIKNIPNNVLAASEKLNFTSGYLVSLGFNKENIAKDFWFYIYDKEILPSRVYSPSLKSPDNVPQGCSSLQAEIYFNRGIKFDMGDAEILDDTIQQFIKMGLFKEEDLVVKDIRSEKYANVIFDHSIYENRKTVLDFLEKKDIISIGRFGEWDYFWSDQSMLSGRSGALRLLKT